MKYNVTKQYIKAKETLIAAFCDINDANLFLTKKSYNDEEDRKKIVYRLYDNFDLLRVVNQEISSTAEAEDAENYEGAQFIFKVKYQLANTSEKVNIAYFNDKEDANLFVVCKCSSDSTVNFDDLFLIFKDRILIDTLNKRIVETRSSMAGGESTGNNKSASFRPSPLPTRPTPPGGPGDCWSEQDTDD